MNKKIEKKRKNTTILKKIFSNWKNIFIVVILIIFLIFAALKLFFFYQSEKVSLRKDFILNNTYTINSNEFTYGSTELMENLDSYKDIRKNLIKSEDNLLDLNLQTMKITFFKNGKKITEEKIAGKGRPGGWWETPPGIYRITGKRKQVKVAASSDKNPVFMPYAMRFSGMFFIHSWPELKDGRKLPGYYTEGCVRLDKKVAMKMFKLAPVGTTVLIYDEKKDNFKYNKNDISSNAFIAADLLNNEVLFAKNAYSIVKIGDLTKLLLYLSITDWIELPFDKIVEKVEYPEEGEYIKVGENYKMFDLGFPLLTNNSNQAATEISKRFKYTEPVKTMIKKAKAVGMKNADILNPLGNKFENTASLTDIELLLKYIYKSRDFILKSSRGQVKDKKYGHSKIKVKEESKFKNISGYYGGMTSKSFGEEIQYGAGVFKIKINGKIRPIGIVIFDSKDIEKDTKNILKKIKSFYSE